jgi:hypothetical protein
LFASLALLAGHARAADVSGNWSGYVATGAPFSGVSGTWTVPPASCFTKDRGRTAVAFWVGLGGWLERSRKIEQVGTASGCNADRSATYFAWYELWPDQPVMLSFDIEAGDRISASVAVRPHEVDLMLTNVTSGRRFRRTLVVGQPDRSSAEWIGEAPSIALEQPILLPLSRFGRVTFSGATATSGDRTAPIGDRAWSATAVRLGERERLRVVPSPLAEGGSAFSLRWG